MIYIFFALYMEAEPFLQLWGLKKDNQYTKYQVFSNERICCIITGVGPMKMTIHSTHFLAGRKLHGEDIFINLGFAGSKIIGKKGIFFIHKIHSHDTGRDFYPEVIYRQPYEEASLESFSKIVTQEDKVTEELVDMEAAAFFETLSFFVKRRQIFVFKGISDFLGTDKMERNIFEEELVSFSEFLFSFLRRNKTEKETEIENYVALLSKHWFCTTSMQIQVKELVRYAKLQGLELHNLLDPYLEIEVKDKGEGKYYVAELRKKILES